MGQVCLDDPAYSCVTSLGANLAVASLVGRNVDRLQHFPHAVDDGN